MAGVTKFRTVDPDNKKLVELYKKEVLFLRLNLYPIVMLISTQTNSGDCEDPTWITPPNRKRIYPPVGTVAIVVDVRTNRGAINIHEKESNEFIDGVGIEEAGKLVIVPWDSTSYYYAVGTVRVAYIKLKSLPT